MPRKSNCCVAVVTLKKCEEITSTKIELSWKSGNICEKGNRYLKKRNLIRLAITLIIFPKKFPHPHKYSWGISYEYSPGWPEPNEKEIIRLCLCHTIFIKFKDMSNSRSSHQRCSIEKAVLKNVAISTRKHLCWSLLLMDMQGSRLATFLKSGSNTPVIFCCEYYKIFKNIYFAENLRKTASAIPASCC